MNTRAAATKIITEVVDNGRSLSDALQEGLKNFSHQRDQAFIKAIAYGVCRWYFPLNAIANLLIDTPLKDKDQDVHILILVGLYQLIDMRIPDYAAVGETVAVTKKIKKVWAKNLVNGVLRQYQRNAEQLNNDITEDDEAAYSHPLWLIDRIREYYPEHWELILEENNQHPTFALRVNAKQQTRVDYLEKLAALEIAASEIPETASGIILEKAMDVNELPGFAEGDISVQDGAAQLAAELLMLEPGQRVLDACAAPGGKTAHILEMQPELAEVVAIDKDKKRLATVYENLERLHLEAECIAADAGDLNAWWDNELFDRILLDAPCSASGVIRRHPDIKLLRREEDIDPLVDEQTRLLKSLWSILKPGGILLYATCSIFPHENEMLIARFLKANENAVEEKIEATWGIECSVGRQVLPGMHKMDGFYYARLRKR